MLFNSWLFIFFFLPAFLLAYGKAGKPGHPDAPALILLVFSGIFYLLWGWQYALLFAAILCMNYRFGMAISSAAKRSLAKILLILAIILNLLPLLWFKYSWFLIENISLLLDKSWRFTPPGLPLGISFYTFIGIAWLTGLYRASFPLPGPLSYAVFATGFPWVISGPIIRYDNTLALTRLAPLEADNLATGLTLFGIGLAKKCVLADSLGIYADRIFDAAEKNWPLTCPEAWLGSFCYTFQLYFDFSGYSDMAIGMALMFGLHLPENFNSPYKSTGIIDFWRRWHMTLGAWLRDFLYIPLGGSRKGKLRKYCNLFATMFIAGLWHGAGWTFLLWGSLHGLMLIINHLFRAVAQNTRLQSLLKSPACACISISFTFFAISLCWIIFRAFSLDGAIAMFKAMFALQSAPDATLHGLRIPGRLIDSWLPFGLVATSAFICFCLPNSGQIMSGKRNIISFKPNRAWAFYTAGLIFVSIVMLGRQTSFLYFHF